MTSLEMEAKDESETAALIQKSGDDYEIKEMNPNVRREMELALYIQRLNQARKLIHSQTENFEVVPDLNASQIEQLDAMDGDDEICVELMTKFSLKKRDVDKDGNTDMLSARLKLLGFRYARFLEQLRRRDIAEQERILLQGKLHQEALIQQEKLTTQLSETKELDIEILERLIQDGFLNNLSVVKNAIYGEDSFGVTVRFQDLNFIATLSNSREMFTGFPTVGNTLGRMLGGVCHKMYCKIQEFIESRSGKPLLEKEKKHILNNLNGVLKPGVITLLLGQPQSGKSSLMHALTRRLRSVEGKQELSGKISYNECNIQDIFVSNVATYVDQIDNHLALMTTAETLKFAQACRSVGTAKTAAVTANPELAQKLMAHKVDIVLSTLGLSRAADTIIGNEVLKGVSGGEKRRVTLGEMLVIGHKVLLFDEISTGLDSAATFDITTALKELSHVLQTTTMVSLLQPPPETFDVFDDILLMEDGYILYHGPRSGIEDYFAALGYVCPATTDIADFLLQLCRPSDAAAFLRPKDELAEEAIVPPTTAAEFSQAFMRSSYYQATLEQLARPDSSFAAGESVFSQVLHQKSQYPRSTLELTQIVLARQWQMFVRDRNYIIVRTVQNILMGSFIGMLLWQLGFDEWYLKAMVFLQFSMFVGFSAIAALPKIYVSRVVFYKQSREHFYPPAAYLAADFLTSVPLTLFDSTVFGSLIYFLCGLTLSDGASNYFTFLFIAITFGVCMSSFCRFVAYTTETQTAGFGLVVLWVVMNVIFSGGVATYDVILDSGWIFMYWIVPLSWTYRSFMLNEFLSDEYTDSTHNNAQGQCVDYCGLASCPQPYPDVNCGVYFLQARQFFSDEHYIWTGIAVVWGWTVLLSSLSALSLTYIRHDQIGNKTKSATKRPDNEKEEHATSQSLKEVASTKAAPMAFKPVVLTFQDLVYTIELPQKGEARAVELDLLKGISGYALPGTMTALMGSSGAGKTTLLDVLAGRKTTGKITGSIKVNGFPKDDQTFSRIVGYVEQFGIHDETSTVIESLQFSAALRLADTTEAEASVRNIMSLLDLQPIADKLVGSTQMGNGLSFEEHKRLTIGVELVANPSILFCDEPTSGLDANHAFIIMQGLKRIAECGCTIICTIHQPSATIFNMFDRLLLMKRGGSIVFFDDLGDHSSILKHYFQSIPEVPPCPERYNPATWMLEVIGAGTAVSQSQTDFSHAYITSELYLKNIKLIQELEPTEEISMPTVYAVPYKVQLQFLTQRKFREYWRSPQYSLMRVVIMSVLSLILGAIYFQQKVTNAADVQSRISVINFLMILTGNYNLNTIIPQSYKSVALFYREKASLTYSPVLFTVSEMVVELPYIFAEAAVVVNIVYWMVGFEHITWVFFYYWGLFFIYVLFMTFLGVFFCALLPSAPVATLLSALFMQVMNLFSGIAIPGNQMPSWLIWIYYLTPMRWAQEGLITTQFNFFEEPICYPNGDALPPVDGNCTDGNILNFIAPIDTFICCPPANRGITAKEYVLGGDPVIPPFLGGTNGYRYAWRFYDLAFLLGVMALMRIGTVILKMYVSHNKR